MADQPKTSTAQTAGSEGREDGTLRKPSAEELEETLEAHDRWVRSNGLEGLVANLQRADLTFAELEGANLVRARLAGADLGAARLKGADLSKANLKGAILREADLEGAICRKTHFEGAALQGTKLRRADLQKADLTRARLAGADLDTADLTEAVLKDAEFPNAILRKANLNGCKLSNLNLLQADLRGAHLFRAELRETYLLAAKLQGANLHGAGLEGAKLENADLTAANLQYANFEHLKDTEGNVLVPAADLKGASFRNADLSDAALSDVSGLQADQLAGSNLSSAKLPPDIKEFEALEHVAEISKHARTIFLGVVGACVYSWLSIATTTDVALITGSTATPLPIIQTPVSIAGFYWAAPPILFVLYVYLHLYLQRMWEGMAELPAVFPDGRTLDKRVYPWLLSGLVAANVALLKERRPPSSWLQVGLSIIAAWGLVPFTLFLFWGRYLTRHDWPWTIWHVILFVAAATYGFASYRLAKATLRGETLTGQGIIGRAERPGWRHLFQGLRNVEHRWVLATAILTSVLSLGAIEGSPGGADRNWRSWVPSPTSLFGIRTFADLREVDVSTKPANWTGLIENAKAELALVKGASLARVNLRHAEAARAFLVSADLRGADLHGANLRQANLRAADLRKADLRGVNFTRANLQFADLSDADLRGTVFRGAQLEFANLSGAKLRGADFRQTDLSKIEGLHPAQLKLACGDKRTHPPLDFPTIQLRPCPMTAAN